MPFCWVSVCAVLLAVAQDAHALHLKAYMIGLLINVRSYSFAWLWLAFISAVCFYAWRFRGRCSTPSNLCQFPCDNRRPFLGLRGAQPGPGASQEASWRWASRAISTPWPRRARQPGPERVGFREVGFLLRLSSRSQTSITSACCVARKAGKEGKHVVKQ